MRRGPHRARRGRSGRPARRPRRLRLPELPAAADPHRPGERPAAPGAGRTRTPRPVRPALERVGLTARADHYPRQLSGGEQQRVAIARAFAPRPQILFADEPTGNLDQATGEQVIDLLFDLRADAGAALVLVTHDQRLAERCDRRLAMRGGPWRPWRDAWRLALRLLRRDWRSGELYLLAAALVLTVAAITAVAFFGDRVERAMQRQGGELIAADLAVDGSPAPPEAFAIRPAALGLRQRPHPGVPERGPGRRGDPAGAGQGGGRRLSAARRLRVQRRGRGHRADGRGPAPGRSGWRRACCPARMRRPSANRRGSERRGLRLPGLVLASSPTGAPTWSSSPRGSSSTPRTSPPPAWSPRSAGCATACWWRGTPRRSTHFSDWAQGPAAAHPELIDPERRPSGVRDGHRRGDPLPAPGDPRHPAGGGRGHRARQPPPGGAPDRRRRRHALPRRPPASAHCASSSCACCFRPAGEPGRGPARVAGPAGPGRCPGGLVRQDLPAHPWPPVAVGIATGLVALLGFALPPLIQLAQVPAAARAAPGPRDRPAPPSPWPLGCRRGAGPARLVAGGRRGRSPGSCSPGWPRPSRSLSAPCSS